MSDRWPTLRMSWNLSVQGSAPQTAACHSFTSASLDLCSAAWESGSRRRLPAQPTRSSASGEPALWGEGATRRSSGELSLISRLGMVPPSALGAAGCQQRPAVVVVVALHHARVVVLVEDLLLLLPIERLHQAQHHGGQ